MINRELIVLEIKFNTQAKMINNKINQIVL